MGDGTAGRKRTAFFVGLTLALGLTALAGFARTFYLQPLFDAPPLTPLLLVHGVFASLWFALLVTQAMLARSGQMKRHRQVGKWGFASAMGVALSAAAIIVATATDGKQTGSGLPESTGLFVQLGTLGWFSVLAALAYRSTARPDYHKHFIAMASIAMMAPVFSRITRLFRDGGPPLFDSAFLAIPFVAALAWHDWQKLGRLHPVTLWAGGGYLLFVSVRMPIAKSALWNQTIVPLLTGG
jgi:hypothetical protein